MWITSDGNVGIGRTDPKSKLHVSGGDIYVDSGKGLRSYTGDLIIDAHSTGFGTVYMYDDVSISGNLNVGGAANITKWANQNLAQEAHDGYSELKGYAQIGSVIFQWGYFIPSLTTITEGTQTITFPISFPNKVVNVVCTVYQAPQTQCGYNTQDTWCQVQSMSNSGATLYIQWSGSGSNCAGGFTWQAIGY